MATVELYGKCRELGYCDCRGVFGCKGPDAIAERPDTKDLQAAARKHDVQVSERDIATAAESIPEWGEDGQPYLVDCEICGRSHRSAHPQISSVKGDELPDDPPPAVLKPAPPKIALEERQLPDCSATSPQRLQRSPRRIADLSARSAGERFPQIQNDTSASRSKVNARPAERSNEATTAARVRRPQSLNSRSPCRSCSRRLLLKLRLLTSRRLARR